MNFSKNLKIKIKEVILATSITSSGQTTAHYLLNNIKKLDVKVTRIARGVPAGGELDYLDEATLGQALNERTLVFDRLIIMSNLKIIIAPDQRLLEVSKPVKDIR